MDNYNHKYLSKIKEIVFSIIDKKGYKVGIVDFALVDEKLKKIALQEIEIWNDPKYS